MANTPWWERLGDQVGFPGVAAAGYGAARATPSLLTKLAQYGLGVGGGLAAAPVAGALTAASVMQPIPANGGEQPLYVRNAQGQWVPNPANPTATSMIAKNPSLGVPWQASGQNAPVQSPAIDPWPGQANGMSAANPSMFSAPNFGPAPAPAPAAAGPAPSPVAANVPMPLPRPQFASVPMPPPRPAPASPMNIVPPQAPAPAAPTTPDFYNGPGSLNYSPFSQVAGGNANATSLIQKFMDSLHGGSLPQTAQNLSQPQQQQKVDPLFGTLINNGSQPGLLQKLSNSFGSFFGGGGPAAGSSMSNPTMLGSLY